MAKKIIFYVLKRLGLGILTYLIVVTITFWVMQLVPGGPWTREKALSDAVIAALNKRYGLDQPLGYLRVLNDGFVKIPENGVKCPVIPVGNAFAKRSISRTVSAGLAMVSPNTALVLGLKAASSSSSEQRGSTKVNSISRAKPCCPMG